METGTDTPRATGSRPAGEATRSLRWAAAAGALAVAGLIALGTTQEAKAQSVGELQGRIDAAESEASDLAASIDSGNAQIAAAQGRAQAAASEEAELATVLAAGEEREAELTAEVDDRPRAT